MKHALIAAEDSAICNEEEALLEEQEIAIEPDLDPVRVYFQQMGRHPLLTREEEVQLFKEMEGGKAAVLDALLKTRLLQKEIAALLRQIETGSAAPDDLLNFSALGAKEAALRWATQLPILEELTQTRSKVPPASVKELVINEMVLRRASERLERIPGRPWVAVSAAPDGASDTMKLLDGSPGENNWPTPLAVPSGRVGGRAPGDRAVGFQEGSARSIWARPPSAPLRRC